MSITSYQTRPLNESIRRQSRIRDQNVNVNGPNANDELTQILNQLHINDLLELQQFEQSSQIGVEVRLKPVFHPYVQWKKRTTSIAHQDIIINEILNIVIREKEESKEEEPSPYNNADENASQVTEDGIKHKPFVNNNQGDETSDDEEYIPDQDLLQELQQEAHKNDLWRQQEIHPTKVIQSALSKDATEYYPRVGTLSAGGNTKLDSIAEDEDHAENETPHSASNLSLSSASSNTNPNILSPSVITQPPSITNSPPPTSPPTPVLDLAPYLQTLQQIPPPSYWTKSLVTVPNTQPIQPIQPMAYVQPLAYPVIVMPLQSVPVSMPNAIDAFTPAQTAVSMPNQFIPNNSNNTITQPIPTQPTEQKEQQNNNNMNIRELAAPSKTKKFEAKFNNHAKGNFYISKEMIAEMIEKADEKFNTEEKNDEKLAFGHYKESVAMSINDKQIDNIWETEDGKLMIIINIDLHFKSTSDVMYLIAMENAKEFRSRVRWCIKYFMSAQEINYKYGIKHYDLPKSSRNMRWFKNGINRAPVGFKWDEIQRITRNTHFKTLPKKTSKRAAKGNIHKSRISQQNLKYYVEQSLMDDTLPIVPVVVIKGKNQCIEWKRFVEIKDDWGQIQYVGISLKFYEGNKQWKIECMDYDSGRVYYQHRLASLPRNNVHHYDYNQISQCITTTLDIYDANRGNYRNNYNKYSHHSYH